MLESKPKRENINELNEGDKVEKERKKRENEGEQNQNE